MKYQLHHGDCLEILPTIASGSIDAIICDPPYGTTACKWDSVIPFEPMWTQLKRLIKPRGAIVLFGSQPFTSALVMSNVDWFKYEWVWDKVLPTGIFNAKKMPLKVDERILVFCEKLGGAYNPIMRTGKYRNKGGVSGTEVYGECKPKDNFNDSYHPTTILKFSNAHRIGTLHPTQKPVPLMEYLIKTYTNEGETVLDFTMGSGSTGVAAINTGRKFIGIEQDADYFQIAKERIDKQLSVNALEWQTVTDNTVYNDMPLFSS